MAKKLVKKPKTTLTRRTPEDLVYELDSIKAQKKLLEQREKELKAQLDVVLETEGAKDDKGSFKLIVGDKLAVKQARTSIKLNNEKAEEFFKSIGIWEDVVETKEVINEDLVEQALVSEAFTMDEFEAICEKKVTYAILINEYKQEEESKEEMTLIETN